MKNKKGSTLVWIVVMILITSIIFLTIGNMYISANSRLVYKVEEKQSYLTAKSVTELLFHSLAQKDEMGIHILAYLDISGTIRISSQDLSLPDEMGDCSLVVGLIENNRLKIETTVNYKEIETKMIGYMTRKYRLYDKDGNLVSEDYQGSLDIDELEEYYIEEYWVVSGYDIEK